MGKRMKLFGRSKERKAKNANANAQTSSQSQSRRPLGFRSQLNCCSRRKSLEGILFWVTCVLVKLLVAFFVPKFGENNEGFSPYKRDVLTAGFSMTCRGELNFIIAAFALDNGVIGPKQYAAITFAVLLSAITSPFILLKCLNYFNAQRDNYLKNTNPLNDGNKDGTMPLHFHISIETSNKWSLLDRIQTELTNNLGLAIEDLRTSHTRGANPTVTCNIYALDAKTRVPIPFIKDQFELHKLEESIKKQNSSSRHLWKSSDNKNLTKDEKEQLKLITAKLEKEETILSRQNEIENAMMKNLADLDIKELNVAQWTPWDWTHVLDTLSLKRANGKEVSNRFLMNLFDVADVDESGAIEEDELFRCLVDGGMDVSREGIMAMIDVIDEDRDGSISRDEWEKAICLFLEKKNKSSRPLIQDEPEPFVDDNDLNP